PFLPAPFEVGGRVVAFQIVQVHMGARHDIPAGRADGRAVFEHLVPGRNRHHGDLVALLDIVAQHHGVRAGDDLRARRGEGARHRYIGRWMQVDEFGRGLHGGLYMTPKLEKASQAPMPWLIATATRFSVEAFSSALCSTSLSISRGMTSTPSRSPN